VLFFWIGCAEKKATYGAHDEAKNLMEAMHGKMIQRENTRPHIFKMIRLLSSFFLAEIWTESKT
jgi:hypothetical protein